MNFWLKNEDFLFQTMKKRFEYNNEGKNKNKNVSFEIKQESPAFYFICNICVRFDKTIKC